MAQRNTDFFVPDLFYIESTNILWKYVRANLYSADDVAQDLTSLKSLSLKVIATSESMQSAFKIAHEYQISAYDASYVALSHEVDAPLLTFDRKLVNALSNSDFNLYFFPDFLIP